MVMERIHGVVAVEYYSGHEFDVPSLVNISTSTTPLIDSSSVAAITPRATTSTSRGDTPTAPRNGTLPPTKEFTPAIPEIKFFNGIKCGRSCEYINPTLKTQYRKITRTNKY